MVCTIVILTVRHLTRRSRCLFPLATDASGPPRAKSMGRGPRVPHGDHWRGVRHVRDPSRHSVAQYRRRARIAEIRSGAARQPFPRPPPLRADRTPTESSDRPFTTPPPEGWTRVSGRGPTVTSPPMYRSVADRRANVHANVWPRRRSRSVSSLASIVQRTCFRTFSSMWCSNCFLKSAPISGLPFIVTLTPMVAFRRARLRALRRSSKTGPRLRRRWAHRATSRDS